ncbi:MAG TPA: hypothetical protein VFG74_04955, partial [Miltoncostaeaceae bacterium]|nr:hypothetical protein [Miltoncostaeaceae bacterium]
FLGAGMLWILSWIQSLHQPQTGSETFFAGVRTQLESGLPAAANPNRHGQAAPTTPPDYLVRFALQQAASAITLIVEHDRALAG